MVKALYQLWVHIVHSHAEYVLLYLSKENSHVANALAYVFFIQRVFIEVSMKRVR